MKLTMRDKPNGKEEKPFWKVIFELRDFGIEEEFDGRMNMYYQEGSDDICELMLIKYPGWL